MVTIYHNPQCGTSRTVLQRLEQAGLTPDIVQYLKTPLAKDELAKLIGNAGLAVREAMRSKEPIYNELGLDDASLSDDDLLDAMVQHPILMNRPFVVTEKGTRLCRPADVIDQIL